MRLKLSRRHFLRTALVAPAIPTISYLHAAETVAPVDPQGLDFPLVDFHVHLDNSTIDKVAELSRQRAVRFGIVEHAGTEENKYPVVLSNDDELKAYLAMLEGQGVYRGVQAEWTDWAGCFSKPVLAQLDYVLTDTMTFPGKDGQRKKMWEPGLEIGDHETFMDRFVEWQVDIISRQPIDILANVSWLPGEMAQNYDQLWTTARIGKLVAAAVKHRVAIEISSSYRLPRLPFLLTAKEAGLKFTFGSNGRYPNMGKLDHSIQTAKTLGLKQSDMFTAAPDGQKAVQRRAPA